MAVGRMLCTVSWFTQYDSHSLQGYNIDRYEKKIMLYLDFSHVQSPKPVSKPIYDKILYMCLK